METERIGISWPISDRSGWGIFGLNLTIELLRRGAPLPLLLSPPSLKFWPPGVEEKLAPLVKEQQELLAQVQAADKHATLNQVLIIHALANQFVWDDISSAITGRKNVGFIFFEDIRLDAAAIERANRFDRIMVGSTWNLEVLKAHGLDHVSLVLQGVDDSMFHPRQRTGMFGDRFVIFSGGKLELRKAQDVVLAAFNAFHESHPDSLLVTAWHNPWTASADTIAMSTYVDYAPAVDEDGQMGIVDWAVGHGAAPEAFADLGMIPHAALIQVLSEVDVALFPNRCEGGTNLVAMEAMASGVPCILSANTGHLDLISFDNCYPLRDQKLITSNTGQTGGWREPSIDEIVATLEEIYENRDEAVERGKRGADYMKQITWRHQTEVLLNAVSDLL